ncbi:amino acid carrier protein [Brachybacterium sp. Marseille-Q7125]|uniref:alanine/glycine:cation symporter family protein n=1 Tax=Brachybacterium sp. Marseille-Q7125 TaxID=2932815 RepID=UPI001FF6C180|nr:amino acid carrier protein [Brachybacterium sp. Marseille-Q7125]
MSGLDAAIEAVFAPIAGVLSAIVFFELPIFGGIPVVVIWLAASAVFFTVWLRFQPITGAKHSLAVIRGRFAAKTDPGEVSSFQALATELSGTVGLGNIAGVAIGITVGGPGAALWIALFGIFAMSVKMAEAVLGNKYRTVLEDGSTVGGPMYMLREGFAEIGWKKLGIAMGAVYAVLALIGMLGGGNMFQANQVTMIISDAFGEESFLAQNNWVVGVVLAAMVAVVVLGGVTSIARWTSRITPYMAIAYILCVLVIVAVNLPQIPAALGEIIVGAFNPQGVAGGAVGVAVVGIQRALFSNAAGVGTAAMSFSATKTRHTASDGYTAMWGPLIDSVVVCMLTAVAIVVTGVHTVEDAEDGVVLTASAFGTVADWFPVLLTIIVFLFGFSTLLSYSFFCEMLATYLFGPTRAVRMTLRVVYVLLVVVGASISMTSMVAFADATTFLVTIPNLIGLYVLAKVVRLEVLRYRYRVETGVIEEIEDEDLRVGMGDHEPTEEQVRSERERTRTEEMRLEELHRRLEADPEWPHSYNKD